MFVLAVNPLIFGRFQFDGALPHSLNLFQFSQFFAINPILIALLLSRETQIGNTRSLFVLFIFNLFVFVVLRAHHLVYFFFPGNPFQSPIGFLLNVWVCLHDCF